MATGCGRHSMSAGGLWRLRPEALDLAAGAGLLRLGVVDSGGHQHR